MKFIISGCTDNGAVRKVNEDKLEFKVTDFGLAAIVCDGMGGHKGGLIAADIAVNSIMTHIISLTENFNAQKEIIESFKKANDAILKRSRQERDLSMMGTTSVLLLIKDLNFFTAHLGDSRIYMIRNKKIRRLTKDHTKVQQLIDEMKISYEQAVLMADQNAITQVLGVNELSKPELSGPVQLNKGDIFLLSTDGLSNYVNDNEILDIILDCEPTKACEQLIYLTNLRNGQDNITALIVKVEDL
ncbi:MAG: protein phosphatase 2C domain-containing protein [Ignavibacteriaceae bacterium]